VNVYAVDLSCPYCHASSLEGVYLPPSKRVFEGCGDDPEHTEHMGETCDMQCPNCGFQFTFHTGQCDE